ncbi:VOC family protein [Vagococcus fluvialis]|jgi:predicted lactoylglutathione lyase|uniref:VOC family protein n=1 Tax=Vagococcus fluvialis TaxID=2738 RepID=UPI003D0B9CC6
MSTMVFVNFPVKDVKASTRFYEALGFSLNPDFSNEDTSCMVWDENFFIMLLAHEKYQFFTPNRTIADNKKTSSALIAFSMSSADEVKMFGEKAKDNGGYVYQIETGISEEYMYGLEVQDLDGNTLEPMWMAQP